MVERELLYKLIHAHDLSVVTGIPTKKSKEVDNSLRKITLLAIA